MCKSAFLRFLLLTLLAVFCSCTSKKDVEQKKIIRLNLDGDPKTLDPRKVRELNSFNLTRALFDGLLRLNPKGEIENSVAEKIEISEDGKKYTFHLRSSYWSNGDPLTSNDFAFSWKKALDPKFCSPMAYQLFPIKGAKEAKDGKIPLNEVAITTPDDKTLQVELNYPTPYFLELLTLPITFPVNQKWEEKYPDWSDKIELFVSNGPFILKDWRHNNRLTLNKNQKYWDKEVVKLDGVDFLMVATETELNLFEKNQLDWVGSPFSTFPLSAIDAIKENQEFNAIPALATAFLRVNTQKVDLPVRKLLSSLIDRNAITVHVLKGKQIPALSLLPSIFGFSNIPNLKIQEKDAKQNKTIALSFVNSDRNRPVVEALQSFWETKSNLKIKLEAVEYKVLLDRLQKGNYELALGSWVGDFSDPINFLEPFKYKNNGTNNTFWESEKYSHLLDEAAITADMEKRKALFSKAEEIISEDLPVIPIYYLSLCYLKNENVEGVMLSPCGSIDFKWSDLKKR